MNRPRPSSEHDAGLFVTIDGPSGVGKTTTITHLAQLLKADNVPVHVTAEPSRGPIGRVAYELTDTVTGPALACLYAADRYHQIQTEIRPRLDAGHLVLCDRYVPSALVMQRLDGLGLDYLWALNSLADRRLRSNRCPPRNQGTPQPPTTPTPQHRNRGAPLQGSTQSPS